MLGGHDIEADVVGDEIFVKRLVEQIGGDLGVAIFVGQTRAHRVGGVEHVLGDEWVGHLAAVESSHAGCPPIEICPASATGHEPGNVGDEMGGLLDLGLVARIFDQLETGARDQFGVGAAVVG